MLSAGDLLWVPFTYGYTAFFLALHPKDLGVTGCAGVLAVQLVGYYIFRTSNNEKNEFRLGRNPKSASPPSLFSLRAASLTVFDVCADLKSFQTERGTRLLTSGWWGLSQHPN